MAFDDPYSAVTYNDNPNNPLNHSFIGSIGRGGQEGAAALTEGLIQRGAQLGNVLGLVSDEREKQIEDNINRVRDSMEANSKQNFENSPGQNLGRFIGSSASQLALTGPLFTSLGGPTVAARIAGNTMGNLIYSSLLPTTKQDESLGINLAAGSLFGIGGGAANEALNKLAGPSLKMGIIRAVAPTAIAASYGWMTGGDNWREKAVNAIEKAPLGMAIGSAAGSGLLARKGAQQELANRALADPQIAGAFKRVGINPRPSEVAPIGNSLASTELRYPMSAEMRSEQQQLSNTNTQKAISQLQDVTRGLAPTWQPGEKEVLHKALKDFPVETHADLENIPLIKGKPVPQYIDPNNEWEMQQLENFRNNVNPKSIPPNSAFELQTFKKELLDPNSKIVTGNDTSRSDLQNTIRDYGYQNVPGYEELMAKDQQDILANRWGDKLDAIKIKPDHPQATATDVYNTFFGSPETTEQLYADMKTAGATDTQIQRAKDLQVVFGRMAASKGENLSRRLGADESNISSKGPVEAVMDKIRRMSGSKFADAYWKAATNPRYEAQMNDLLNSKNAQVQEAKFWPLIANVITSNANSTGEEAASRD